MPSLANPFTLQKQFLFTSAFTCLVLCATLAVILSSFWAFAPLFIAALFYSILRWPVQLIAAILFLVPFLPLPSSRPEGFGFFMGRERFGR
jgi:O-antigen/teichoic acid export membrane protein